MENWSKTKLSSYFVAQNSTSVSITVCQSSKWNRFKLCWGTSCSIFSIILIFNIQKILTFFLRMLLKIRDRTLGKACHILSDWNSWKGNLWNQWHRPPERSIRNKLFFFFFRMSQDSGLCITSSWHSGKEEEKLEVNMHRSFLYRQKKLHMAKPSTENIQTFCYELCFLTQPGTLKSWLITSKVLLYHLHKKLLNYYATLTTS